ncbi:MAG: hypothetical protein NVS1B2_27360 [Vulcanimicrobiaceae bacterium]
MSDALLISALVPGAYPSQNHTGSDGRRGGKKSKEYHALFSAVEDAAMVEVERVGWICAEYLCDASVTLYHPTRIAPDASNLAKCELDALTAAGVWANDRLARPVHFETEYDPQGGESRIVIVVRRRCAPYVAAASPMVIAARRARSARVAVVEPIEMPLPGVRARMAYVDGKPVPVAQALAEIRAGRMR